MGGLRKTAGTSQSLNPEGAIIAKRSGYCTMIAYVPSPTQLLIQLPGSESSSGESSLLVQGMDYDKIGYVHSVEGWVRHTCREQQENIADWRRLEKLSDSMHPAQRGCSQLKEARGTAGNRNADEPVLVEYYTGICPAGITAELLGLHLRSIGQSIRTSGRGASVSGPAMSMSESLASATSGQPLNLQPSRRMSS